MHAVMVQSCRSFNGLGSLSMVQFLFSDLQTPLAFESNRLLTYNTTGIQWLNQNKSKDQYLKDIIGL